MDKFSTFIALCAIGGIIIYFVLSYLEKKRSNALETVATALQMQFCREGYEGIPQNFEFLPLFQKGDTPKSYNMFVGNVSDLCVRIFDYDYTDELGTKRYTYKQTVFMAIATPSFQFPAFTLKPEGLLPKTLALIGVKEINFKGFSGFSQKYCLNGADEQQIRALFSQQRLSFFENSAPICVEASGDTIIVYYSNYRECPSRMAHFLKEGLSVIHALKS